MREDSLRRGEVVEVKSPAEILATLDERAMLDGLPFMPEMLRFAGKRFTVDRRASKLCDTIGDYTSREMPRAVILEDLRCDGSAHDGCQAECRLYWKESWLKRVEPGAANRTTSSNGTDAGQALEQRITAHAKSTQDGKTRYVCQATELSRATFKLNTFDPRPYLRELTSGNVGLGHFLQVMARALYVQPLHRLRLYPVFHLKGTRKPGSKDAALGLQPGDVVRVKTPDEIAKTLTPDGKNRGLWFDREMRAFCGGTFTVRQRVKRFIDDRTAEMIELKTDSVTLEGVACSGERSTSRWFCPRAIYPYWREAWLEPVRRQSPEMPLAPETVEATELVPAQAVEHVGLSQVSGPSAPTTRERR
jgi:hypothetical protein